ncbi:hypothetical protein [Zoogloea sp.]|uniref:hypothetical protein n=1 Tax=Zoogloea sp. TaxID=49181 RepID=UPI0035B46C0C
MPMSLNKQELLLFAVTAIRCLIAKGLLSKEDIMADLARQNIDLETAFKIHALLKETPEK